MFKNYLKVTLRSISRNAIFVIINLITLGLALAICIVAYLNSKYDADWDRHHLKGDEIYKVIFTREVQGRQQPYSAGPIPVGSMIGENFSGVEQVIRYTGSYSPLKVGIDNFSKRIGYVDPGFIDVFTIQIINGSAESLKDRQNILINDRIASIYFGEEDPIGKLMSIFNDNGEEYTYTVGGVFEHLPLNSSFYFEVLCQMDNYIDMWNVDETDWATWIASTFLHIPNPAQVNTVETLLQDLVEPHNMAREDFQISEFRLVPFLDIGHKAKDWWSTWWLRQSFHPAAVGAPPIMALLILLIACFNFTNTSIAFSSKRLKEIGVRKVAGGHRKQIIMQFMSENFLLTFLSLVLALFFAKILVPLYSQMWEYMDLEYSLASNPEIIGFLIVLLLFTTLFAGAYPSFYISRFNPILIFQDKLKIGGKNALSAILLTLQIAISVQAINSGVLFTQNANFQDNQYLGYDKEHIIGMYLPSENYFTAFRDEVRSNPMIQSVGESNHHIGSGNWRLNAEYNQIKADVSLFTIGDEYFETMGLTLLDGRTFSREYEKTDNKNSIIVNQKFLFEFGIDEPLGKRVMMADTLPYYIVGVMADFYPYGFWAEIEPTALMRDSEQRMQFLTIKTATENLQEVNTYLEETWKELIPTHPYGGFFQDSLMEEAKQINKNIKAIYIFLAIIALFLAAVGLYTLVSLNVIRKTKEVGVRKVMGASIPRIVLILSKSYMIMIAIASVIGLVAGHYSGLAIMQSIWKVHTEATILTFALPVILIVLVAGLSIGWKVYVAASRNPTESLRYE
ncbi:FtsX-like permease family protein [Bacteroidota bacterium]